MKKEPFEAVFCSKMIDEIGNTVTFKWQVLPASFLYLQCVFEIHLHFRTQQCMLSNS